MVSQPILVASALQRFVLRPITSVLATLAVVGGSLLGPPLTAYGYVDIAGYGYDSPAAIALEAVHGVSLGEAVGLNAVASRAPGAGFGQSGDSDSNRQPCCPKNDILQLGPAQALATQLDVPVQAPTGLGGVPPPPAVPEVVMGPGSQWVWFYPGGPR